MIINVPCREREGVISSVLVRLSEGEGLLLVDADESPLAISPRKGGTFSLFPSPSKPVSDTLGRFGLGVWSGVGGSQVVLDAGDDVSV